MITFLIGLMILFIGYKTYSNYVEKQFCPNDTETPATTHSDGVDYVPMGKNRNCLIQLLNIAGMGPILGAIQGILFGPIAFILIPLGCVFMGGVHDYFSGMISVRNGGLQITGLIKKFMGETPYRIFIVIVAIMLLLLTSVFVCTSGDVIAERFFNQQEYSIHNPIMIWLYVAIAIYFIFATMFPIDKIIGKIYPFLGGLLILGTALVSVGFFVKGVNLTELNFNCLNLHPNKLAIIPMFFMTVSCGLLSGFHATQSTIISRTITSEKDGKRIFFGMMCLESLIAMIWAAGAMNVYSLNLVPENIIGTANAVNDIADFYVPAFLTFVVTLAVVTLPITSGDTALRGLRMIIADALKLPQTPLKNRMVIIVPIALFMLTIVGWSKMYENSFSYIWRYFTFFNQLIAIPTFIYAAIYLFKSKKNYWITLIPALFYVFITMTFIFNSKIGFDLPIHTSKIIGAACVIMAAFWIKNKMHNL